MYFLRRVGVFNILSIDCFYFVLNCEYYNGQFLRLGNMNSGDIRIPGKGIRRWGLRTMGMGTEGLGSKNLGMGFGNMQITIDFFGFTVWVLRSRGLGSKNIVWELCTCQLYGPPRHG